MKLLKVELRDFRQYKGLCELEFSHDAVRNVTLIHGMNGAGKTNLLEAMKWCLFGHGQSEKGAAVNTSLAADKDFNDIVQCSVTMHVRHDSNDYCIRRIAKYRKLPPGESSTPQSEYEEEESASPDFELDAVFHEDEDFVVLKQTDGGLKQQESPSHVINFMLPPKAQPYFLFDGEKIDELSKPGHEDEVKEAIRNVLQLPALERGVDHLESLSRDLLPKQSKDDGSNDLMGEIRACDREMERLENQLQEHQELKKHSEALEKEKANSLRRHGSVKNLLERRRLQSAERERVAAERASVRASIAKETSKAGLTIALPWLRYLENAAKSQFGDLGISPYTVRTVAAHVLETGRCICGNVCESGTLIHEEVSKWTTERPAGEDPAVFEEIRSKCEMILDSDGDNASELMTVMSSYCELGLELERLDQQLAELGNQLKSAPEVDIAELETQREKAAKDVYALGVEIALAEKTLEDVQNKRKKLTRDKDRASSLEAKSRSMLTRSSAASDAAGVLERVLERLATEKRLLIRDETKKMFDALAVKQRVGHFSRIDVTPQYSLEIFDRYNRPVRSSLSSGEREVLSLSFIGALSVSTAAEIPLVMDSPFGRLFSDHRRNIWAVLPEMVPQLVMLVQDEEFKAADRTAIGARIGAEFDLVWEDGVTSIQPHQK